MWFHFVSVYTNNQENVITAVAVSDLLLWLSQMCNCFDTPLGLCNFTQLVRNNGATLDDLCKRGYSVGVTLPPARTRRL